MTLDEIMKLSVMALKLCHMCHLTWAGWLNAVHLVSFCCLTQDQGSMLIFLLYWLKQSNNIHWAVQSIEYLLKTFSMAYQGRRFLSSQLLLLCKLWHFPWYHLHSSATSFKARAHMSKSTAWHLSRPFLLYIEWPTCNVHISFPYLLWWGTFEGSLISITALWCLASCLSFTCDGDVLL